MWPFKQRAAPRGIRELREELDTLSGKTRALTLDFEELYEKVRRALQRISKRAEVVEKADRAAEPEPQPNGQAGDQLPQYSGRLSDRQREIQQQILRRRSGQ